MEYLKHKNRNFRHVISGPFILGLFFPLVLIDLCAEIYHRVCFPLYGLPYVKRSTYIRIDRHKLSYLNPLQKLFCLYCSYANGWVRYASVIAAETERYWCAIQHQSGDDFVAPAYQADFVPYGDQQAFEKKFGSAESSAQRKTPIKR